jgi:hypothetical protein
VQAAAAAGQRPQRHAAGVGVAHRLHRPVAAALVDDDDLVRRARLPEHGVERRGQRGPVVAGDDEGADRAVEGHGPRGH